MSIEENRLGPVARRLAATQRVLCVEDEADIAAFLRAYFRASGYDFVHVDPADADAAIAVATETEPDIVLLDLRLRGFSGMEVYRRMRADQRWAFVPIILVSAHAESDPAFEAPKGLDAFVGKPFNTNDLAELLRSRLELSATLAETGRHPELEVMTQQYLETRLADEAAIADVDGPFSFGLFRLTSLDEIVNDVGRDGRDFIVTALIRNARALLPPTAVFGLTDTSELAVILPATPITAAERILTDLLASIAGTFTFVGGATAQITVSGGIAAFPDHAHDIDELFMAADAALVAAIDSGAPLRRAL